jgi:hypothetical protein
MLTGRPVRYVLGREEEMQFGSPRGAERIFVKDGVMRDGRLVARQIRCYFDSGAYTRLSSYAVIKCAAHIPGPYTIPNVHADVYCVYTNRTPLDGHARVRRHRGRLRHGVPRRQDGPPRRHGPDGVPHPQRLPGRGHEGPSAGGQEHGADRVRAGGSGEGEVAGPRGVPAPVVRAAGGAGSGRRCRRRRGTPPRGRARWSPFRSGPPTTVRRSPRRRPWRRRRRCTRRCRPAWPRRCRHLVRRL